MFHPIIIIGVLLSERSEGSGEAATCKLQNLIQAALYKMHNPALAASSRKARGTGTSSRQNVLHSQLRGTPLLA